MVVYLTVAAAVVAAGMGADAKSAIGWAKDQASKPSAGAGTSTSVTVACGPWCAQEGEGSGRGVGARGALRVSEMHRYTHDKAKHANTNQEVSGHGSGRLHVGHGAGEGQPRGVDQGREKRGRPLARVGSIDVGSNKIAFWGRKRHPQGNCRSFLCPSQFADQGRSKVARRR